MSEWKSIQLGDHAEVLSGFPFPSQGFSQEEGVPLIRIRDLLAGELETYFIGPYPDDFVIDNGDILIGMDGDFNIVRWTKGKALLNQRVCKVFTSTVELDDGYLFWLLDPKLQDIHQKTPQTTVKHLSVRDLAQLRLEVPPVNEQRLVAYILDTLDTQIQQTEALIAKLERVKEGLLHDLLTRGIDENGQLRPSPEQAPELYKESPLGLIPKTWHVSALGSLLDKIEAGKSPSCPDIPAPSGEWGVLKVSAVNPKGFRSAENKVVERTSLVIENYEVKQGDLLITRANTPDLVGSSCIVEEWVSRLMLSDKTLRLVENSDFVMRKYLYLSLQQSYVRKQISIAATGTSMSMKNISQGAIRNLSILVTPIDEQSFICKRVAAISKRISYEQAKVIKLYQDKAGLMDDLLTGRVRVTPLLDQAQATTPA